jgi:hypothetical protein
MVSCYSSVGHRCRQDDVQHPIHVIHPAAKLTDVANLLVPELSFQRQVIKEYWSRQPQDPVNSTGELSLPAVSNFRGNPCPGVLSSDTPTLHAKQPTKRNMVVTNIDSNVDIELDNPRKPLK